MDGRPTQPGDDQRDGAGLARVDDFVAQTRGAVYLRRADDLLLIRPDKTLGVNATAAALLETLYRPGDDPPSSRLGPLSAELGVSPDTLIRDALELLDTVGALINEDYSARPNLRFGAYDRGMVRYPTLAEIALTYGCQNRCTFCYASSPHRQGEHRVMTTEQVKVVMDKILNQGHVPSLSFTGGEATLRPDLPELVRFGRKLGLRVNLITNGIRAADPDVARTLCDAGLSSAQVSLEAGEAEIHDEVVGRKGAFAATVAGVKNFRELGIHVHTNTTLCPQNIARAHELVKFVGRKLSLRTLSMNMVIRTGEALCPTDDQPARPSMLLTYTEVARRLPSLLEVARQEGVRLVWYSPMPYCIFNPVLHDLGAKSCACVDGILSVDPSGQVLPCSSFSSGIGSLLHGSFDRIYNSRAARYWRDKAFSPPVCRTCDDRDVCGGGCPLYWDAAGSFEEIPMEFQGDTHKARQQWERRRWRGRSFGVGATPQTRPFWQLWR